MAYLQAFGSYLPERVVSNAELASEFNCEQDWILNVSGIRERRYAAPEQTVVDLGVRAAEDCLTRGDGDRSRIALILVASGSAERRFPGPAVSIGHRLGLAGVPAIDLPMASTGSLFAIALAGRLSESYGDILVIAPEKMSAVLQAAPQGAPRDRNLVILFGDGAGACLVSRNSGRARIVDSILRSDGSFAEDLRLEFDQPMAMNGRAVIMQASRKIPSAIRELLERNGRRSDEIDAFLMHQANQNLIDGVAKGIGVPSTKFFSNIARYGNTSSASMLIAAAEWSEQHDFRPDQPVVFAGFGAGFSWGALLVVGC
jgi:3-oxoacyl-[acyl-carrier-protein] synthase-3